MTWYAFFKSIIWALLRAVSRVRVEGHDNLPESGPFLLAPNHQSVLDPLYIQSSMDRDDVFTLTKSTQFANGFFRWLLPRVHALPTRRYRVDPQVVRVALRHLEAGHGLCIYPEGERAWDGAIQPLRRGAVRLMLKAGVPVIPCGIEGSFDIWPRWSRRIRPGTVTVRFGAPIHLGRHDDRREREARLEETEGRIREALSRLSGAPLATEGRAGAAEPFASVAEARAERLR